MIIKSLWESPIFENISNLEKRYACTETGIDVTNRLTGGEVERKTTDEIRSSNGVIYFGKHGRSIKTQRVSELESSELLGSSIKRGEVVLEDRPCIAVEASSCGCSRGPVLTEHIIMTWALMLPYCDHGITASFMEDTVSIEKAYALQALKSILADVCSGLDDFTVQRYTDVQVEEEQPDVPSPSSVQWDFSTQCLMAAVASICCLYAQRIWGASPTLGLHNGQLCILPTSSSDTGTESMKATVSHTMLLFSILARLPANVHAITKIVSSSDSSSSGGSSSSSVNKGKGGQRYSAEPDQMRADTTSQRLTSNRDRMIELTQRRVGYALFLRASAANHSCKPNAAVRFVFPESTENVPDSEPTTSESVMASSSASPLSAFPTSAQISSDSFVRRSKSRGLKALADMVIEIVATEDIPNGEEVCISYGPLAGKHPLSLRRRVLREQYLFHCQCRACHLEEAERVGSIEGAHGGVPRQQPDSLGSVAGPCSGEIASSTATATTTVATEPPAYVGSRMIGNRSANAEFTDTVSSAVDFVRLLDDVHARANAIAVAFTEAMSVADRKGNKILFSFEQQQLVPFTALLREIRASYFKEFYEVDEKRKKEKQEPKPNPGANLPKSALMSTHYSRSILGRSSTTSAERALYLEVCSAYCVSLDMHARLKATVGCFTDSSEILKEALQVMTTSGLYDDNDVVVARERVKLAQVLLSAGNIPEWFVSDISVGVFVRRFCPFSLVL
jgi:hypothetical protein